ncbi:MAG TPA: signal peptidase I [Candidatus Paceibacterota bacterium]|nr:signal peptidase I [Candidatus Paceibacterota bacterium]
MRFSRIATAFILLGLALAIVIAVNAFVAEPFIVNGISMQPSYNPGDYLVIDRLAYRHSDPQIGDVIVFQYPLDPSIDYIKRVVARPGALVDENTGRVLAASSSQSIDPYLMRDENSSTTIELASDEYFVLGDNRAESSDSRVWGPLQRKYIIGKVVARLWPLP